MASADNCEELELELPFLPWLDPMTYVSQPGGTFESESTGWRLGAAKIVEGNEHFYVRARSDSHALSIPAGSSVTTSTMCVGINEPTLRLFTSSAGGGLSWLKVEVLFEDSNASVAPWARRAQSSVPRTSTGTEAATPTASPASAYRSRRASSPAATPSTR